MTDNPKDHGEPLGDEGLAGVIGRREFLKVAGMAAMAGTSVVRSLFDRDLVPSASAQGSGDAASRAATAAAALARRRPGVTIRIFQPFYTLGAIQPVAEQWTKDTGIPVWHIESPLPKITQRMLQEAKSRAFDLALALTYDIPDLVASGVLVDLTDLAQEYNPDREAKGCQTLYTVGDFYQGRLYGLCADGDTLLMFYRKDLLDNKNEQQRFADTYGYPLKIPATWKELDDMIQFFHRPDKGLYGGGLFRVWDIMEWISRYHAKGHYLFDDTMHPQINNDAGVKALEEMLAITKYLDPGARTNDWWQHVEAYRSGQSFANWDWGAAQKLYWDPEKSQVYGKLAWGMMPGGLVKGKLLRTPAFLIGHSYVVSTYSPIPEIAYLFCQYAYSPRMSTITIRDRGSYLDPFRECHYTDPVIRQIYGDGYLNVHRESLSLTFPDLYLRGRAEYWEALLRNLQAADLGQKTPKAALDEAVKAWNRITERLGKDSQITQWRFLKSQYPAHMRAVLR